MSDKNLSRFFFFFFFFLSYCIFWHYCRNSFELRIFLLILGYILKDFIENFVFEGL